MDEIYSDTYNIKSKIKEFEVMMKTSFIVRKYQKKKLHINAYH